MVSPRSLARHSGQTSSRRAAARHRRYPRRGAGGTIQFDTGSAGSCRSTSSSARPLGPDAAAKVFSVDLRKAKIDSDFLVCFRALPELKELDLEETKVSDDGLDHLRLSRRASHPDAGCDCDRPDTPVSMGNLAQLQLRSLRTLSIQGTKITDVGLSEIAKLPGLTDLLLNGTETTWTKAWRAWYLSKSLVDLGLRWRRRCTSERARVPGNSHAKAQKDPPL